MVLDLLPYVLRLTNSLENFLPLKGFVLTKPLDDGLWLTGFSLTILLNLLIRLVDWK